MIKDQPKTKEVKIEMKAFKYFTTCWNCEELTVQQSPIDLRLLENSCEHFPCNGTRCDAWKRRRHPLRAEIAEDDNSQVS